MHSVLTIQYKINFIWRNLKWLLDYLFFLHVDEITERDEMTAMDQILLVNNSKWAENNICVYVRD